MSQATESLEKIAKRHNACLQGHYAFLLFFESSLLRHLANTAWSRLSLRTRYLPATGSACGQGIRHDEISPEVCTYLSIKESYEYKIHTNHKLLCMSNTRFVPGLVFKFIWSTIICIFCTHLVDDISIWHKSPQFGFPNCKFEKL